MCEVLLNVLLVTVSAITVTAAAFGCGGSDLSKEVVIDKLEQFGKEVHPSSFAEYAKAQTDESGSKPPMVLAVIFPLFVLFFLPSRLLVGIALAMARPSPSSTSTIELDDCLFLLTYFVEAEYVEAVECEVSALYQDRWLPRHGKRRAVIIAKLQCLRILVGEAVNAGVDTVLKLRSAIW